MELKNMIRRDNSPQTPQDKKKACKELSRNKLKTNIDEFEGSYELDRRGEDKLRLTSYSIDKFLPAFTKSIDGVDKEHLKDRNTECNNIMTHFNYNFGYQFFRNFWLLSFKGFDLSEYMFQCLDDLRREETALNKASDVKVAIVASLKKYEKEKGSEPFLTLSYRALRLLYVMLEMGNFIDSSMLASMLINQMELTRQFLHHKKQAKEIKEEVKEVSEVQPNVNEDEEYVRVCKDILKKELEKRGLI